MSREWLERMGAAVVVVGIYLLAALPMFKDVRDGLVGVAGLIVGWVFVSKPGDKRELAKVRASLSPPPR